MLKRIRHSLPVFVIPLLVLAPLWVVGGAEDTKPTGSRVVVSLELWRENDPKARLQALRRLARLGPRAAAAVPALIPGLSDRDPKVRKETANVLHQIGPPARAAVPVLVAALNDPDRGVRAAAASALQFVKPDPKAVIPALVANVRGGPDRRCMAAVYALAALGEPAVPVLVDLLKDSDPKVSLMASNSLYRIGPAARSSIPALIEALRLPHRETRERVAWALAGAGPEAVQPLIRALRDRDPKVRGGAALALEKMGERAKAAAPTLVAALADLEPPDDPRPPRDPSFDDWQRKSEPRPSGYDAALCAIGAPAVPALLGQLGAPDRQARIVTLRALGFLGNDAKRAVPRLVALLDDPDLRGEAASALGGIGGRDAIPSLIAGLKDPDPGFRSRTAETLGRIGWERRLELFSSRAVAVDAIRLLAAALKDPDPGVREAAAWALGDIGPKAPAVILRLVAALSDPVTDVRLAAVRACSRVRHAPAGLREAIVALLKDSDPRVREAATRAIDEHALKTDPGMAALLTALKDPNAGVRAAAAQRLCVAHGVGYSSDGGFSFVFGSPGLVQNPADPATLREALGDPDPRVRAAVARLLAVSKGEATALVPLLTDRLKDPNADVRRAAGETLSRFGPAAKDATPALLEALADPDEHYVNDECVSAKAAKALEAIGPAAKAAMIDRLTGCLDDPDKSVRHRASWALQMLREKVAPALFRLLADPRISRPVKVGILGVLAAEQRRSRMTTISDKEKHLGPEARHSILTLREFTRDEDEKIRADAYLLLIAVEGGREAAARSLLEAVRVGDMNECDSDYNRAVEILQPSAAAVLIEGLKDPDEEVRTAAAYALAELPEPWPDDPPEGEKLDPAEAEARAHGLRIRSQAADALVAALKDPDTQVRWAAAWALYALGTGEQAVPALIEMVKDRTTRVATGARIRLASIIGDAGLGNCYEYSADGEMLRVAAIQALSGFGAPATVVVPALTDVLGDGDELTCWFAAGTLGEIGPEAKAAVPALIRLLRSSDKIPAPRSMGYGGMEIKPDRLKVAVAKALGQIGSDAGATVAALTEALAASNTETRTAAAEALGRIGTGPTAVAAVPGLIAALKVSDRAVRTTATEALGKIGDQDDRIVPALAVMMRDSDCEVRDAASDALATIGIPAIPILWELLRDDDHNLRNDTALTLSQMANLGYARREGETDDEVRVRVKESRDALFDALMDPDERIRTGASHALGYVGKDVVPDLVAALKDPSVLVRLQASRALEFMGREAVPALDPLRAWLDDPDPEVRRAAEAAINAITTPDQ